MKKLLLSLLACGSIAAATAQNTGLLLYGSGTYYSSRGSDKNTTGGITNTVDRPRMIGYEINPGIGWSLNDMWAVGVQLSLNGTKTSYDDPFNTSTNFNDVTKTRDMGAGPFIRYTKMFNEHFFMFMQATFTYDWGKEKNEFVRTTRSTEDTYNGLTGTLIPAFGVRCTETVSLSFGIGGIGYQYRKYDFNSAAGVDETAKTSAFGVTFGQQFNVGIQKYCSWGKARRRMQDDGMEPGSETRKMDTKDDEKSSDDE